MSDYIERDKIMNFCNAVINRQGNEEEMNIVVESFKAFAEYVKALPSSQTEQRWILCHERMPEEHEWIGTKKFGTTISGEVYVTFENEKGERFCKHMTFQNGELSRYEKMYMDAWFKDYKPVAWMPLPEPYAERKTNGTR